MASTRKSIPPFAHGKVAWRVASPLLLSVIVIVHTVCIDEATCINIIYNTWSCSSICLCHRKREMQDQGKIARLV